MKLIFIKKEKKTRKKVFWHVHSHARIIRNTCIQIQKQNKHKKNKLSTKYIKYKLKHLSSTIKIKL